jgi:hypothetical protein
MKEQTNKLGRPLALDIVAPWPELFKYEQGQAKLAARLGVSQTTVGKWARGVHRIPELARKELRKLCKRHGIKEGINCFENVS